MQYACTHVENTEGKLNPFTIYLMILELMARAWSVEITPKAKISLTFEIPKCLQKLGGDLSGFSLRWRCETSSLEYEVLKHIDA